MPTDAFSVRFGRAIRIALAAAAEPRAISLDDALGLTILLRGGEQDRYQRAAARWLRMYLDRVPDVDLAEARLVVDALEELPGWRAAPPSEACRRLAERLRQRQL